MKKGVVHKIVVHYFVDFIKKSHKINSLFIFFTSVCLRRFFLLYSYLSIADFHGVFLMCHISALGCM